MVFTNEPFLCVIINKYLNNQIVLIFNYLIMKKFGQNTIRETTQQGLNKKTDIDQIKITEETNINLKNSEILQLNWLK